MGESKADAIDLTLSSHEEERPGGGASASQAVARLPSPARPLALESAPPSAEAADAAGRALWSRASLVAKQRLARVPLITFSTRLHYLFQGCDVAQQAGTDLKGCLIPLLQAVHLPPTFIEPVFAWARAPLLVRAVLLLHLRSADAVVARDILGGQPPRPPVFIAASVLNVTGRAEPHRGHLPLLWSLLSRLGADAEEQAAAVGRVLTQMGTAFAQRAAFPWHRIAELVAHELSNHGTLQAVVARVLTQRSGVDIRHLLPRPSNLPPALTEREERLRCIVHTMTERIEPAHIIAFATQFAGTAHTSTEPQLVGAPFVEALHALRALNQPAPAAAPSADASRVGYGILVAHGIYASVRSFESLLHQSFAEVAADGAARGRARGPLPGHSLPALMAGIQGCCIRPGDLATATTVFQDSLATSRRQGTFLSYELVQRLCDSMDSVERAWYCAHELYRLFCAMPAVQPLAASAGDRIADALAVTSHMLSVMLCNMLQDSVQSGAQQYEGSNDAVSLLFSAPALSASHAAAAQLYVRSLARSFGLSVAATGVLLWRQACRRDGLPSAGAFAATHLQLIRVRNAPPTALWTLPRLRQVCAQAQADCTAVAGERRCTRRGNLRRVMALLDVRLTSARSCTVRDARAAAVASAVPAPSPPTAHIQQDRAAALSLHPAPKSGVVDQRLFSAEEDAALVAALTDPLRSLPFDRLFVELGSRMRRTAGSLQHRWYSHLKPPAHKKRRAASSDDESDEYEEPSGKGEKTLPVGRRWESWEDDVLRQASALHPNDAQAAVRESVQYLDLGLDSADPQRTANAHECVHRRLALLLLGGGEASRLRARARPAEEPMPMAGDWTPDEDDVIMTEIDSARKQHLEVAVAVREAGKHLPHRALVDISSRYYLYLKGHMKGMVCHASGEGAV